MTEPKGEAPLEQPSRIPGWCSRNKKYWIPIVLLFIGTIILVSVLVARKGDNDSGMMSFARYWDNQWEEQAPNLGVGFQAKLVKLTGTWNNRMVVAGTATDGSPHFLFKEFEIQKGKKEWTEIANLHVEDSIASMDVSKTGLRVVVAFDNPIRVQVFDRLEDSTAWTQYGTTIELTELDITNSQHATPTVLLSDDGRRLALGIPTEKVHVLKDVNSLGGTVGGNWQVLGDEPVANTHDEEHGDFATYIGFSGDGTKLAIASEIQSLSVHHLSGKNERWGLIAEYDESPIVGKGDLVLSSDGETIAVGGYDGHLEGSGELHIINVKLPWYVHNEDELENASMKVALSGDGTSVVLGRYLATGKATLQVYDFNEYENDWLDRGTFGNFDGQNGNVDMSNDGQRVAAVADDKLFVYEHKHW